MKPVITTRAHPRSPIALKVLLVTGSRGRHSSLRDSLRDTGFTLIWHRTDTKTGFLRAIGGGVDVLVVNSASSTLDPFWIVQESRKRAPDTPCIVVVKTYDQSSIEYMKLGAADCLLESTPAHLGATIVKALERPQARNRYHGTEHRPGTAQNQRDIEALLRGSSPLGETIGLDAVLLNLVEAAARAIGVRLAAVATFEAGQAFYQYTLDNGPWHTETTAAPLNGSIADWVHQHGQSYRSNALEADSLLDSIVPFTYRPRSLLAVPVKRRNGSVSSMLALYDRRDGLPFSDDDLRLAEGIAHHAAIALERATLTSDLSRTTRALTLLEERERVSMDLHDGAIQSLYGVMLSLGAEARKLDDKAEIRAGLQRSIEQLGDVIQEIRHYISGLWTQELGARGLPAGLVALADDLRLNAQIKSQLDLGVTVEHVLPPEIAAQVLLIAREAISNIIRHSAATSATIRVNQTGGKLRMSIRDNGQGFEPGKTAGIGQGLRNIARRARRLDGVLSIESSPGQGSEVRLEIPVDEVDT